MYRWPYANLHPWHGRMGVAGPTEIRKRLAGSITGHSPAETRVSPARPQVSTAETRVGPEQSDGRCVDLTDEYEWLSIVNYISLEDDEGHDFEAEALGYFWGFSRATGAMLLAVETDPSKHDFHLLVGFRSSEQKKLFLDLAAANELTELADDIVDLPMEAEIRCARGPEYVFDEEILRVARPIADNVMQLLWPVDGNGERK